MKEYQLTGNDKVSMIRSIIDLIKRNPFFFGPYFCFMFLGIFEMAFLHKGQSLLWINSHHNSFLDTYFHYWTDIGNGIFYAIILVPLAILRLRYSLAGLAAFSLSGIGVQIMKFIFDMPRPKIYFEHTAALHFVTGVNIYSYYSFPSGHSATAFSMFLLFALLTGNKYLGAFYLLCASMVALSRIYLAQHFFVDVYFGSLMGVTMTLVAYTTINHYLNDRCRWCEYSLFKNKLHRFMPSWKNQDVEN